MKKIILAEVFSPSSKARANCSGFVIFSGLAVLVFVRADQLLAILIVLAIVE